jgi:hypothetical protein
MGERVEGESKRYWLYALFLVLPVSGAADIKEAVDQAIESAGPGYDALVDGVLYQTNEWYLIVFSTGYRVEGTPIKTSMVAGSSQRDGISSTKQPTLYHSSLGISNEEVLTNIKVIKEDQPKNRD